MTYQERRAREIELLRDFRTQMSELSRDIERTVGRIHLLDELLKEGEDAPTPTGTDAPQ